MLTVATDGEIAAVTMPHIRKHVLIFHSYFHLRGEDRLVDSQDVKRLQLNVQEFITRLALQRLDLRLDSERHRLAGETGGLQWLNADEIPVLTYGATASGENNSFGNCTNPSLLLMGASWLTLRTAADNC